MVLLHAAIIGYVRSQVARLKNMHSSAVCIGTFRFQQVGDPSTVYCFNLHAVLDPTRRHFAQERIEQKRLEILEATEQLLRQVDPEWLADPAQAILRDRLMEVIIAHINEPVVQRVVITGWLQLPASAFPVPPTPPPSPSPPETHLSAT